MLLTWYCFFDPREEGTTSAGVVIILREEDPYCTVRECKDTGNVKGKPSLWEFKILYPEKIKQKMLLYWKK